MQKGVVIFFIEYSRVASNEMPRLALSEVGLSFNINCKEDGVHVLETSYLF